MKTSSQLPYSRLQQFLLDLGFAERIGKDCIVFTHKEMKDTAFFFPLYKTNEKVDRKDLVVVRKMLDERGLMTREDFERWLHQTAAA
jgi:hypothetical protein